jgi:hypothetical protein
MNYDLFAIESDGVDALLCRAIRICELVIAFVMKDANVKKRVPDDVGTEISNTRTWLQKLRTSDNRTKKSRGIILILESILVSLQHLEDELRRVAHMNTIGFWLQTDSEKVRARLHLNNVNAFLKMLIWKVDVSIKNIDTTSELPGFSNMATLMDGDERIKRPMAMSKKVD